MRTVISAANLELAPPRIVAVRSPANAAIQEFFADLAIMWRTAGLNIAGLLDQVVPHFMSGQRVERVLFNIATGARYPIIQDARITAGALNIVDFNANGRNPGELWRNPSWRRNDSPGFAAACLGVENAIHGALHGAVNQRARHLVILSRFGKAEAQGGGLRNAFLAAFDAGVPLITSVSPCAEDAWLKFTKGAAVFMDADQEEIETWRMTVARADAAARRPGTSCASG